MIVCKKYKDRLLGLMFKKHFEDEYLFPKCKSVHTFFMKINIDIIGIDRCGKIIKIYNNVSPNKIIFMPHATYSILETNCNSKYEIGNFIKEANFN